jgi:hypothetical protein
MTTAPPTDDKATPPVIRPTGRAAYVVAGLVALDNPSWLTLENLSRRGTFRSSASWPDTKVLSLIAAALTLATGTAVALRAWRALNSRPVLPKAMLRE